MEYGDYPEISDIEELQTESESESDIEEPIEVSEDEGIVNDYEKTIIGQLYEGTIDDINFDIEILRIEIKKIYINSKFNFTDDAKKLLDEINDNKKTNLNNYTLSKIDEFKFNTNLLELLLREKELLNNYKIKNSDEGEKLDLEDLTFEEKLAKLEIEEEKFLKKICKKYNIPLPDKSDTDYENKIDIAFNSAKKFIPGYIKINNNTWEIQTPINLKDLQSKKLEPKEVIDDLLSNHQENDFIILNSYIQKLYNNKKPVLKFNEYPDTLEKLKEIIDEENLKYYRVSNYKLFQDFMYSNNYEFEDYVPNKSTFEVVKEVKIGDTYVKTNGNYLIRVNNFKKLDKNKNTILQKGNVASIMLKSEFFGQEVPEPLDDKVTEKYYNIIKPIPDELYKDLKIKNGKKTEIIMCWELNFEIDNKKLLTRRYVNFDDYLLDLISNLEKNYHQTDNITTKLILNDKINKIKYYLENKTELKTYGIEKPKEDLKIQRQYGLSKIKLFILEEYPDTEILCENFEKDIYELSTNINYVDNYEKFLFILKNYPDIYEQLMNTLITVKIILNLEIDVNEIANDPIFTDEKEYLKYIQKWKPKNDLLNDDVLNKIKESNYLIKKYKEANAISNIEVQEIFIQYFENKQWEESLKKKIPILPNKISKVMQKIKFLIKERNKLPSRRIFRVAKISERIEFQNKLIRLISAIDKEQDVKNITNIAIESEKIIFDLSNKPNDYKKYTNLVEINIKEYFDFIKDKREKVIGPFIIEFIIKEGNFNLITPKRIELLDSLFANSEIIEYIKTINYKELIAYRNSLKDISEDTKEEIDKEIDEKEKELLLELETYDYIPPTVSNELPIIKSNTTTYIPDYIIINDKYIYGGQYPDFTTIDKQNYTRDNLEDLCKILNIIFDDKLEDYELYLLCMKKIQETTKNKEVTLVKKIPNYDYKNEYIPIMINYIYRDRPGVPKPGEIYIVYKDPYDKSYAIPYTYNNFIPVYDKRYLDYKKYVVLDGPMEFIETSEMSIGFSRYYIEVEYLDKFGRPVKFREGVNEKIIKHIPSDKFDPCNRFLNEADCNNINSYGLKGYKCKYIGDICKSVLIDFISNLEQLKNNGKYFEEQSKNNKFLEAIDIAKLYIEDNTKDILLESEKINKIKELEIDQLNKLYDYYKLLSKFSEKLNYATIDFDLTMISETSKKKSKPQIVQKKGLFLPFKKYKRSQKSSVQLIIGEKYIINEKEYKFIELIDKKPYFIFDKEEKKYLPGPYLSTKLEEVNENKYYYISDDLYKLLNNPPSDFYYYIQEVNIDATSNLEVRIIKNNRIPLEKISEEITLKSIEKSEDILLTRDIITNVMYKMIYNTYTEDYKLVETFPATINAKKLSMIYSIDLVNLRKQNKLLQVREITTEDVKEKYYQLNPEIKIKGLKERISKAVEDNNIKLLKKLLADAIIEKESEDVIELAKDKIKEIQYNQITDKLQDLINKFKKSKLKEYDVLEKLIENAEELKYSNQELLDIAKQIIKDRKIEVEKIQKTKDSSKKVTYDTSRRRR